MGENTKIEWAEHTFNPWMGCTKVSTGDQGACEFCYAEVQTPVRAQGVKWGNHPRHRTAEATWQKPRAWNRAAAETGTRPFVFCASLADVFDNQVDPAWRRDLFDLICETPNLVWLLLTKRPQNIERLFAEAIDGNGNDLTGMADAFPPNVALMCTVVTQEEANRDVIHLVRAASQLGALFAGVSCEPLFGAIDFHNLDLGRGRHLDAFAGVESGPGGAEHFWKPLGWVISGGESGPHARASNPLHHYALRDQCAGVDVPYLFKQWGEWSPNQAAAYAHTPRHHFGPGQPVVAKIGKKVAGRELDGVVHDGRPVVDRIAA